MPFHMHPVIRFREEVAETEGILPVKDSTAVTILKTQESLGQKGKVIPPPSAALIVRGNKYVAN